MRTLNDAEMNAVAGGGLQLGGAMQATRSVLEREHALDARAGTQSMEKEPASNGPVGPVFPMPGPCNQDHIC